MSHDWIDIGYLLAAVCFILALKLMNSPITARRGNWLSMVGMAVALVVTMFNPAIRSSNLMWIAVTVAVGSIGGIVSGRQIQMTAMPQMVALLNGLGGGAVALVALYEFLHSAHTGIQPEAVQSVTTVLSAIIGSISFSGSLIAFGKLQELLPGRPIAFPGMQIFNLLLVIAVIVLALGILAFGSATVPVFIGLLAVSLVLGVTRR
jgi:NAD(P) transhydrogenase subunit beta